MVRLVALAALALLVSREFAPALALFALALVRASLRFAARPSAAEREALDEMLAARASVKRAPAC